ENVRDLWALRTHVDCIPTSESRTGLFVVRIGHGTVRAGTTYIRHTITLQRLEISEDARRHFAQQILSNPPVGICQSEREPRRLGHQQDARVLHGAASQGDGPGAHAMLLPSFGVDEENGAGAVSATVNFYSVNDASGPEHQLTGPERGGNGGIGRCVFRLNVTAAPAIPVRVTYWPAAMRFRIEGLANREQAVARSEFLQTGLANHLFASAQ